MSAECSDCGSDLVYPIGFPMVGVCERCGFRDELAQVRADRENPR